MRLVSFDVGLRNLAVCILEGTNRSDLKIVHWDLIDVMAESSGFDSPKCIKCKKPANWRQGDNYACTKHKTSGKTFTKTSLQKKTVEVLKKEASKLHPRINEKITSRWSIYSLCCNCMETMYQVL